MKIFWPISAVVLLFQFSSCSTLFYEEDPANDPVTNFEILWETLNERYSFFEYKNVDWDAVYQEFRPRIYQEMNEAELWDVCTEMLDLLRDGHVNLRNENDIYFYPWYSGAPENFDEFLLEANYWGNFEITGAMRNTIIDSIGYIYYRSFNGQITEDQLDYLAEKFAGLAGLIIDLRNNEGGNPENGFRLARRFIDERRHIYTTIYKDGTDPDAFTPPEKAFLEPEGKPLPKQRVAVLCNRTTYSAGNFFIAMMKAFPNVTVIGDRTGGGGGAPVGWELPNGWYFNFSSSITWLPDGFIIEDGVDPDIRLDMSPENQLEGRDDILERALQLFN